MSASRLLARAAFVILGVAPALLAQTQPADIYWSDRWNTRYHHFSDSDGDGTFLTPGEVSLHINPTAPEADTKASSMRVTLEDGELVSYWIVEDSDLVVRGVDTDSSGSLSGGEITIFRDTGALDGSSIPQALDLADDGAVWWTSALLKSQPHNGLSRLEDLNDDGDAADAGEHAHMVDGNVEHPIEHDLGSTSLALWSMTEMASVGDGMMAYDGTSHAVFRFEDLNGDGDVLDAGESVLLLNATGDNPALPMNPDFGDGTLKSLQTPAGFPTQTSYMASAMEDGVRVYYFGTNASPFSSSGTNLDGQGVNFLIFRAIDGNGDRDVNDAGEVTLFFDGSHTDGDPPKLLMRGMDVLDGGQVYAVELKPFPALFPGENGNAWIHTLRDLNGDGDAMDAFEEQGSIFDLQVHGHHPELFPIPPNFGNVMSDPWDFSVHRTTPWTDMGGGSLGVNGVPTLQASGPLTAGSTLELDLTNAPADALMLFRISLTSTPANAVGGSLYTLPYDLQLLLPADANGEFSLATSVGPGAPAGLDLFFQFIVQDLSVPHKITLSNAVLGTTP
jgi:hypothetical protein